MINDYVFKTKGRLPFFLSAPAFKSAEYTDYSEDEIEKDASMLLVLLINAFHPNVGVKLRDLMDEAGALGKRKDELMALQADTENPNLTHIMMELKTHEKNVAKFFDRLGAMATERLMSAPENDEPPIT